MNRLQLIHGENEIKTLRPKIKKILAKIDEHDLPLHKLNANLKFINEIINTFELESETSTGTAYLEERQVIKIGYLTRRPPDIKYRVPTLIYAVDEIDYDEWDSSFVVMIQPRVKLIDEDDDAEVKRAFSWFKNIAKTTDIRADNIGIYRKQYKLFDW